MQNFMHSGTTFGNGSNEGVSQCPSLYDEKIELVMPLNYMPKQIN